LIRSENITLISFGHFDKELLMRIASAVGQEYNLPVAIIIGHMDISEFYEPGRRQYDANRLLKKVEEIAPAESVKTLGLFSVDLFIPILTYIFGQAYLNGHVGIASTYRLKNELYGMKQSDDLLQDRFRKVCIHELGHTFGLIHCHSPNCVMKSSTYVEDIDLKHHNLCHSCRKQLGIMQ